MEEKHTAKGVSGVWHKFNITLFWPAATSEKAKPGRPTVRDSLFLLSGRT